MGTRLVVTVDGLVGTGKSSLAGELAKRLGAVHFSSGQLYRAVGKLMLELGVDLDDEQRVLEKLNEHSLRFIEKNFPNNAKKCRKTVLELDGEELDPKELSVSEVSEAASKVAVHSDLRRVLLKMQQEVLPGEDIVAEGRDMGTVVFPEAPVKFFIETDVSVRAERRLREIMAREPNKDPNLLKQQLEIELHQRDERDTQRATAPTIPAKEAIFIDNSAETLTNVVNTMYARVADQVELGSNRS